MEHVKYGKLIKHLSDSLGKKTNHLLKAEDLSMTQGVLIRLVSEEEGHRLPIKEIEKKFGVAQSTIYGVISRLESKGLVSTYAIEGNTKMVQLTAEGHSKVAFIDRVITQVENDIFQGFTDAEKATFTQLLIKAENNMR